MPRQRLSSNARILFATFVALAMPLSCTYALAQTETVLFNFQGGLGDGANPNGGLIADASGKFYGTTVAGGTNGTVFEFIRGGARNEVPIHFFNGADGNALQASLLSPTAPLIFDRLGNLFGTTPGGVLGFGSPSSVFELSPSAGGTWTENTILQFVDGGGTGITPLAGLVLDAASNLYGTTFYGSGMESPSVAPPSSLEAGSYSNSRRPAMEPGPRTSSILL